MWTCKMCNLQNYNDNVICKACFNIQDEINNKSLNEYVMILKNTLNEQATEIKRLSDLNMSLTNSFEDYKNETEMEMQRLTNMMDTQRSDSLTALSRNMFTKLLDSEQDHRDDIERYETKIKYLEKNLGNKNIELLFGCCIDKLIPQCLKSEQRFIYTQLFNGYVRKYNKNIPHDVVELISYFYPIFSADHIADFMKDEPISNNDNNDNLNIQWGFNSNDDNNNNNNGWSWDVQNNNNNDNNNWSWNVANNNNNYNESVAKGNNIFSREDVHKITEEVMQKVLAQKQQFIAYEQKQDNKMEEEERKDYESDDDGDSSFDDDYDSEYDGWSKDELIKQLKEEKGKNVFIEKQRNDSLHNLHNNMFQKLLDNEIEYEEEIEILHQTLNGIQCDFQNIKSLFGYNIHELIPKHLDKGMKIQYGLLFGGFIRQCFENRQIPDDIIELITQLYPIMMSEQYNEWIENF